MILLLYILIVATTNANDISTTTPIPDPEINTKGIENDKGN